LRLKVIDGDFSVCKTDALEDLSKFGGLCFVAATDEERSIVCKTQLAPQNCIARVDGWCCFRVEGQLDFSLVGILAKISAILAENKIGIFAVSTYNTDYIFTKRQQFDQALSLLALAGYQIDR